MPRINTHASFSLEYSLLHKGYNFVAGVDEVGRGCLAGPLVSAIVVVSEESQFIPGVKDSKLLSATLRDKFDEIIRNTVVSFGIGVVPNHELDDLGINGATRVSMQRAYDQLSQKPDIVLVDGKNISSPHFPGVQITAGDRKHFVISAASVIAKVYRDQLMTELADKFPGYDFENNVGYGTKRHYDAINSIGICELHRKSFSPIKQLVGWEKHYDNKS
ncbi:ribonuclease HII [Candidatus Dojkabacteria bacterium]|nr:ribonuclease HII [Candidatus Dojkabacteria bacterium]